MKNYVNYTKGIRRYKYGIEDHYLLRRGWSNDFNKDDLFGCLLFKEYKFKIVNQKEAEIKISKKQKRKRIKELERELEKLKRNEE